MDGMGLLKALASTAPGGKKKAKNKKLASEIAIKMYVLALDEADRERNGWPQQG